jgi:hypothetical protein
LVWAALDPERALKAQENLAKLNHGSGVVEIVDRGQLISASLSFPADNVPQAIPESIDVVHVDTTSDVGRIQSIYASVTDLEAFLNGAGVVELSPKELDEVNYLTRRYYDSVRLFEVELADETVPFFELTLEGQPYDSRTMGSGEFAAFLIWWHLRRAETETIFLLEEPESFLSPQARSALIDVLLKAAFEKQLCIIMTSHSGEMIGPLPAPSVRFFRRDRNGVKLATDANSPALLKTIGISTHLDVLVFVEDEAAKSFSKLWVESFNSALAQRMEVVVKGSDGEIVKTLKAVETKYKSVSIVGLFDGDAKGKLPKDVEQKAAYLPGDLPIEKVFRRMLTELTNLLETELGWRNLSDILFSLNGDDHHDWYEGLAQNLGIQKNQLFMALFSVWMKQGDNALAARKAFQELSALLGEPFESDAPQEAESKIAHSEVRAASE